MEEGGKNQKENEVKWTKGGRLEEKIDSRRDEKDGK